MAAILAVVFAVLVCVTAGSTILGLLAALFMGIRMFAEGVYDFICDIPVFFRDPIGYIMDSLEP